MASFQIGQVRLLLLLAALSLTALSQQNSTLQNLHIKKKRRTSRRSRRNDSQRTRERQNQEHFGAGISGVARHARSKRTRAGS